MKFDFNWRNLAALLTGVAGLVVSLGGSVPSMLSALGVEFDPEMAAQMVGGASAVLLTLAGQFSDDDGDGVPNIADTTPQG